MRGRATAIGEGWPHQRDLLRDHRLGRDDSDDGPRSFASRSLLFTTLPVGFNTQLAATGIYSDDSTAISRSLPPLHRARNGVASVSNAAATRDSCPRSPRIGHDLRLVPRRHGNDTVVVSGATLVSISISPPNATITAASSLTYTATGVFSDASQMDVTNYATWLSSNSAVADVSNAAGSRGLRETQWAPSQSRRRVIRYRHDLPHGSVDPPVRFCPGAFRFAIYWTL